MIWIGIALVASAFVLLLVHAARRYERESAAAALERVKRLEERADDIQRRIENLEAIASGDDDPDFEERDPDGSAVAGRRRSRRQSG